MARASVRTLLPIDSWAKIMGINPWEFNQIGEGFPVTNTKQCPHVWYQYQWQKNHLSREEIAEAIASAEQMIAQQLLYWPAPKAFIQKVDYPRPAQRDQYGMGGTPRHQYKSVQLDWGKIINPGIYKRELIDTVSVTLSDADGDGVNETFTCSITTDVTAIDEIVLYFTDGDRLGQSIDETWRIRPVKVEIESGTATITGHSSLLVKPEFEEVTDPEVLNVGTASIYVDEVDIYRVYISSDTTLSEQGIAMWDNGGCDTPPCGYDSNPVCISPRVAEQGVVAVDFLMQQYCRSWEPDRLQLNYIAGVPLVDGRMDEMYARIVARLATALLPSLPCGCDRSQKIIDYWREAPPAEREGLRAEVVGDLTINPFGPKRGAVWAWDQVEELKQVWGTSI